MKLCILDASATKSPQFGIVNYTVEGWASPVFDIKGRFKTLSISLTYSSKMLVPDDFDLIL